jgi:hypothetical protein
VSNQRIRQQSFSFFFAAVLLVLFGVAAENNQTPHAHLQIALALLMGGAGVFLRTGTPEARAVGLIAAGTTLGAGAYALVTENIYIPGTIIAVFALFQLWNVGTHQQPAARPAAQSPAGPLTPFGAPDPYAGPTIPAQPFQGQPFPVQPPVLPTQPPAVPGPTPFFAPPVSHPDDPA